MEIVDSVFGFILWLSGYFFLLILAGIIVQWVLNFGEKLSGGKNKLGGCTGNILILFGGLALFAMCILAWIYPYPIANLVNSVFFGGGEIKFSVAFNHLAGFVSTWVKSSAGASLISAISFLAWFIGLISGTISIYEFFSKRFRNQNKKGIR